MLSQQLSLLVLPNTRAMEPPVTSAIAPFHCYLYAQVELDDKAMICCVTQTKLDMRPEAHAAHNCPITQVLFLMLL